MLLAWMSLCLLTSLAFVVLLDLVRYEIYPWLIAAVYLGGGGLLFAACAVAAVRAPQRWWPASVALLTFCVAIVPLTAPLAYAGVWLNFQLHKPAYEAVITDWKAGRLPNPPDARGCVHGSAHGVEYSSFECTRPQLAFPWGDDPASLTGVMYDEEDCPRAPPEPLPPPRVNGEVPPMKNAGKIGSSLHLGGRYCLFMAVF